MNQSANDQDGLVQRQNNPNHSTMMSHQMHVPESITIGPNRSSVPRLHQDNDRLPVRMEVPDSIRLGGNVNTELLNYPQYNDSNSTTEQLSRHPSDIEAPSEDDFTTIDTPRNHQPIRLADSWHIEPFTDLDDKNVLNKLQLLQNRIHHIERSLARRDFRDRIVYPCILGYFFLQILLSIRRSMLN